MVVTTKTRSQSNTAATGIWPPLDSDFKFEPTMPINGLHNMNHDIRLTSHYRRVSNRSSLVAATKLCQNDSSYLDLAPRGI
jgi:hypothetical protein